nr:39S ribosomal protein L42, mitochondrial-like [Lepeophtheirus salmonis]
MRTSIFRLGRNLGQIACTKDGSVIVAWHPPRPFPYECTQPLPETNTSTTDSKLNVQYIDDMKNLYRQKHERFVRRDLMRLTWTTKHRWFPPGSIVRKEESRKTPREKPFL